MGGDESIRYHADRNTCRCHGVPIHPFATGRLLDPRRSVRGPRRIRGWVPQNGVPFAEDVPACSGVEHGGLRLGHKHHAVGSHPCHLFSGARGSKLDTNGMGGGVDGNDMGCRLLLIDGFHDHSRGSSTFPVRDNFVRFAVHRSSMELSFVVSSPGILYMEKDYEVENHQSRYTFPFLH